MRRWLLALSCFLGAACAGGPRPAHADEGRWELLGRREADFRADKDTIEVTAAEGLFNAIRFHVKDNGVEILDVDVQFSNGERCDVEVREHIAAGSQSRVIDLPGAARHIKKVVFKYRTRGVRGGKADIALWGRHAGGEGGGGGGGGGGGEARERDDEGWELLGRREVNWTIDRDEIHVGGPEGRFKKLQVRVKGHAIEIHKMKVIFGNGEHHEFDLREKFAAGSSSRIIDIPGEARFIKTVVFVYDKVGPRPGPAVVAVWAKND
jgi:hypothetical protein